MQNLLSNLRYTLRQFRLSPMFTTAAIFTLALGIGGTTAIFTLIHAVMLRSLPVSDPAVVGSTFMVAGQPFTVIGVAPPAFFGETLRSDPPDIWLTIHQEPLVSGQGALLNQSVGAWLRMIGRLRPGASAAGMAPRLT